MYQLTEFGVIRLNDNAFIPDCADNRDWQEYQKWLDEGNTPEPMPPPPPDNTLSLINGQARQDRIRQQKEQQLRKTVAYLQSARQG